MFDTVTEMERREGLGGFITRHFGPLEDQGRARKGVRNVALVLLFLSGLAGISSWSLTGPSGLILPIAFGVPALILLFRPSRLVASVLLALALLNAVLVFPEAIYWVWVLLALRGVQWTVRLRAAPSV